MELQHLRTPVVILERNRSGTPFCTVAVDDVLGGRIAVGHLIDAGHRRIAFAGGSSTAAQVRDRLAGAREAWREAGHPAEDLALLDTSSLDVAAGRAVGQRLIGIPVSRRPTAAFCPNDLIAVGLLEHALGAGADVPDDLAIVGYDDIGFVGAAAVPLTSVRQPRHGLGRTAAELLLGEAAVDAHEHRAVLYQPELVARASTTPCDPTGQARALAGDDVARTVGSPSFVLRRPSASAYAE